MSKKVKPVTPDFNTLDTSVPQEEPTTVAEKLAAEKPLIGQTFNDKVQAELEKIEYLEAENLRLTNENSDLKQKLAEYIEQAEKTPKPASKNPQLETENKQLREENDSYLMKISELTFENAKLEAKLQESTTKPAAVSSTRQNGYKNVYRNAYRDNGYSAWN